MEAIFLHGCPLIERAAICSNHADIVQTLHDLCHQPGPAQEPNRPASLAMLGKRSSSLAIRRSGLLP